MFTVKEIADATGGRITGNPEKRVCGVSTDSRNVTAEMLFVPLKGEHFDGHDYLPEVFAKGTGVALVAESRTQGVMLPEGAAVVVVPDTLKALGDLAACFRRRFSIPVAGITGSNGKTTTKEMLAAILGLNGPGLKTSGNLNNLIGLPQMVFQLGSEHRWAIFEMGMSEPGEIDRLAQIAAPEVGVITNAFPAHLASMGSIDAVAKAKGELFLRLAKGGSAIFNADDPLISQCPSPAGVCRRSFGLHGADVTAVNLVSLGKEGQRFTLQVGDQGRDLTLRAFGTHNIYNALAAAAAAHALGAGMDAIVAGLSSFSPYDKRFKLEDLGPIVLIDDSYNANPASAGAALLTLRELKEDRRGIAVLGDMLELGEESVAAHRDVGRLAANCIERLYVYGAMGNVVAEAALDAGMSSSEVIWAATHDEILQDIVKDHLDGDYILVKGSRGMRMDIVSSALRKTFSGPDYGGIA